MKGLTRILYLIIVVAVIIGIGAWFENKEPGTLKKLGEKVSTFIERQSDDEKTEQVVRDENPTREQPSVEVPEIPVQNAEAVYSLGDNNCVVFSPDGRYVVTGDNEGKVTLSKAGNGEPIHIIKDYDGIVSTMDFSPDGKYFAVGVTNLPDAEKYTVALWNACYWQEVWTHEGSGDINVVTFNSNGQHIATGDSEGYTAVRSVNNQNLIGDMKYQRSVNSVSFKPDTQSTCLIGTSETLESQDTFFLRKLGPGIKRLPSGGFRFTREDQAIWQQPGGSVNAVAFSPDGSYYTRGTSSGKKPTLCIWKRSGGTLIFISDDSDVNTLAFSPKGDYLAAGSEDRIITFYRIGDTIIPEKKIKTNSIVQNIAWSPDGTLISDSKAVYRTPIPKVEKSAPSYPEKYFLDNNNKFVAFSKQFIATAGDRDKKVTLWRASDGKRLSRQLECDGEIFALTFSFDGQYLATGDKNGKAIIWKLPEGREHKKLSRLYPVYNVSFSPDGQYLAVDNEIWNLNSDRENPTWDLHFRWHGGSKPVAFNPASGKHMAVGDGDEVIFWEIPSEKLHLFEGKSSKPDRLKHLKHESSVRAITFRPDGRYLATLTTDSEGKITFWDVNEHVEVGEIGSEEYDADVNAIAFRPDGQYLATGGADSSITFWRVPEKFSVEDQIKKEKEIQACGSVEALAWSPDGSLISDGKIVYETFLKPKKLDPPNLIATVDFSEEPLEVSETRDITVTVENNGKGDAFNVLFTIEPAKIDGLTYSKTHDVGDILAGKTEQVKISVKVSQEIQETSHTLMFRFSEKKGFPPEDKRLLIFTKPYVKRIEDYALPQSKSLNPNAVAVVIGIKDYGGNMEDVKYALRDAQFVRQYLVETFGYAPENILPSNPKEQITSAVLKGLIKNQLPAHVKKGISDVFIYYSGHGAPGNKNGGTEPFLLPSDCNPSNISDDNAYRLSEFYEDLNTLGEEKKFKSITVVLDACFTGTTKSGNPLVTGIKGLTNWPDFKRSENPLKNIPNAILITSAASDEVSTEYPDVEQGMFTYFFLKALQGEADKNEDNRVTVAELEVYLIDENDGVPYWSGRKGHRHTPQIKKDKDDIVIVEFEE